MAKKNVSVFFCQECGNETSKWSGQCPACGAWNSLVEEVVDKTKLKVRAKVADVAPTKLIDVTASNENRISTNIEEFDRVLGGGIVPGSMVLVGGDPGIGKSTLLLQTCRLLCNSGVNVMQVSGEESLQQIKIRADRIGQFNDKLDLFCETNLDTIKAVVESLIYDKDENSQYVGEIGDKVTRYVTCKQVINLMGYYGPSTMFTFFDADGNVFVGDAWNCFDGTIDKEQNLALADLYWKNAKNTVIFVQNYPK